MQIRWVFAVLGASVGLAGCPPDPPPEVGLTPCTNPDPILQIDGETTGYVQCSDGSVNRTEGPVLAPPQPPPACPADEVDVGACDGCSPDAHCFPQATVFPNGCACTVLCTTDDDCAADEACLPIEASALQTRPWHQCAPARCRSSADCDSGECGLVALDEGMCGSRLVDHACRTPTDACRVDADCPGQVQTCVPNEDGVWTCRDGSIQSWSCD